ncbi:MAG: beta-lactamase family protein [Verrucomicrobia bacterium]|nr:beta-lactamase family protein [Verrucomicrobiota bacterium]
MKTSRSVSSALLCLLLVASATAAPPNPAALGMDAAKLKEIPKGMQKFVEDGTIAGAVTLVARGGGIACLDAVGFSDLATKKPMRVDDLFWIASMTKPVTATAVMMLQDEGKLSVEDPVEKYLPEFKDQWMIAERGKDSLTLKRPARPITLRDLLTHTSGLANLDAPRSDCSLAELAMACAQKPLEFPPGSKWSYCNTGINTLGRIVEVASGQSYATFLETRLFKPLGMKDTTFWPSAAQARRVAKSYTIVEGHSGLVETNVFYLKGSLTSRARTAFPAGGLYSTAADLAKFYRKMLAGGASGGRRYVSKAAFELMTRTQTGELKTGFVDGMSFGFGWAVVRQPQGVTAMLSPGTFGHGGAYGTQGWIDPKQNLIVVMMIQRAKLQPNADASDIRCAFQEAAVAAIKR